jgi:anti-anti-sigma factor
MLSVLFTGLAHWWSGWRRPASKQKAAPMFLVKDPNIGMINHFGGPEIVEIAVTYADDLITVTVAGELDVSNSAWLHDTLHDAIDVGAAEVLLELRDLSFMDSTGLAVLASAQRRMQSTGGTLAILHPTLPVKRLLEITGLLPLLALRRLPTHTAMPADAS